MNVNGNVNVNTEFHSILEFSYKSLDVISIYNLRKINHELYDDIIWITRQRESLLDYIISNSTRIVELGDQVNHEDLDEYIVHKYGFPFDIIFKDEYKKFYSGRTMEIINYFIFSIIARDDFRMLENIAKKFNLEDIKLDLDELWPDEEGCVKVSLMQFACQINAYKCVEAISNIIDKNINNFSFDLWSMTPMLIASWYGSFQSLQCLLNKEGNPNLSSFDKYFRNLGSYCIGINPIHSCLLGAINRNNSSKNDDTYNIILALLNAGAKIDAETGPIAMHGKQNPQITDGFDFSVIRQKIQPTSLSNNLWPYISNNLWPLGPRVSATSALHLAVCLGELSIIELLLQRGCKHQRLSIEQMPSISINSNIPCIRESQLNEDDLIDEIDDDYLDSSLIGDESSIDTVLVDPEESIENDFDSHYYINSLLHVIKSEIVEKINDEFVQSFHQWILKSFYTSTTPTDSISTQLKQLTNLLLYDSDIDQIVASKTFEDVIDVNPNLQLSGISGITFLEKVLFLFLNYQGYDDSHTGENDIDIDTDSNNGNISNANSNHSSATVTALYIEQSFVLQFLTSGLLSVGKDVVIPVRRHAFPITLACAAAAHPDNEIYRDSLISIANSLAKNMSSSNTVMVKLSEKPTDTISDYIATGVKNVFVYDNEYRTETNNSDHAINIYKNDDVINTLKSIRANDDATLDLVVDQEEISEDQRNFSFLFTNEFAFPDSIKLFRSHIRIVFKRVLNVDTNLSDYSIDCLAALCLIAVKNISKSDDKIEELLLRFESKESIFRKDEVLKALNEELIIKATSSSASSSAEHTDSECLYFESILEYIIEITILGIREIFRSNYLTKFMYLSELDALAFNTFEDLSGGVCDDDDRDDIREESNMETVETNTVETNIEEDIAVAIEKFLQSDTLDYFKSQCSKWKSNTDEKSGKIYYYNPYSNESIWSVPDCILITQGKHIYSVIDDPDSESLKTLPPLTVNELADLVLKFWEVSSQPKSDPNSESLALAEKYKHPTHQIELFSRFEKKYNDVFSNFKKRYDTERYNNIHKESANRLMKEFNERVHYTKQIKKYEIENISKSLYKQRDIKVNKMNARDNHINLLNEASFLWIYVEAITHNKLLSTLVIPDSWTSLNVWSVVDLMRRSDHLFMDKISAFLTSENKLFKSKSDFESMSEFLDGLLNLCIEVDPKQMPIISRILSSTVLTSDLDNEEVSERRSVSKKLKKLLVKSCDSTDLNMLADSLYLAGQFEEAQSVYMEAVTTDIDIISIISAENKSTRIDILGNTRYYNHHHTFALSQFGLGEVLAAQGKVNESIYWFSESYSMYDLFKKTY